MEYLINCSRKIIALHVHFDVAKENLYGQTVQWPFLAPFLTFGVFRVFRRSAKPTLDRTAERTSLTDLFSNIPSSITTFTQNLAIEKKTRGEQLGDLRMHRRC